MLPNQFKNEKNVPLCISNIFVVLWERKTKCMPDQFRLVSVNSTFSNIFYVTVFFCLVLGEYFEKKKKNAANSVRMYIHSYSLRIFSSIREFVFATRMHSILCQQALLLQIPVNACKCIANPNERLRIPEIFPPRVYTSCNRACKINLAKI